MVRAEVHSTEFRPLQRLLGNRNVVYRLFVGDELVQVREGEVSGLVKEVETPKAFVSGDLH